jgi:VIT1/CCC1 family predicted Fe2+/Mn2+ transporter
MSENNPPKTASQLIAEMTKMQEDQSKISQNKYIATENKKNDESVNIQAWTPELALTLSFGILFFGVIIIAVMAYLLKKGLNARSILRLFSVPLIIVSAIFLVVAGYGEKQISPVIGLLGTIAGYLLGNSTDNDKTTSSCINNQNSEQAGQPDGGEQRCANRG